MEDLVTRMRGGKGGLAPPLALSIWADGGGGGFCLDKMVTSFTLGISITLDLGSEK